MSLQDLANILSTIRFRDWELRVRPKGDGFLIQWVFEAADRITGNMEPQHCRKWYVSSHATPGEVIRTAWAGVEMALLHEAREDFTVGGKALFNPHFVPSLLAEVCTVSEKRQGPRPVPRSAFVPPSCTACGKPVAPHNCRVHEGQTCGEWAAEFCEVAGTK